MALSYAESLRAFRDALTDFTNYAKEVSEANAEEKNSPEFKERRGKLTDSIRKHRRSALVAGVHAGQTLERMTEIVDRCVKMCIEHKRVSAAAPSIAYASLVGKIVRDLQSLEDLIALAESRETTTQQAGAPRKKNRSIEARDKWIYEQCCKGVPYQTIALRLPKHNPKWPRITTKQGILFCARKYAEDNGLPQPPSRQSVK